MSAQPTHNPVTAADPQPTPPAAPRSGRKNAVSALLNRNPSPTDPEIRSELDNHRCRCGAYDRILRAIRRASHQNGKKKAG